MLNRRHLVAVMVAVAAAVSLGSHAWAADKKPFDQKAFEQAQAPILSRLKSEPRFKDLVNFNIDFDSQKDLRRTFGVRMQSTLIVFKGRQETGRSTGDTNPASIEALLTKAI